MATETQYGRSETLPPEFYRQFFAGVPGANVPGILPLMNQALVNYLQSMGERGGTPYTYTGERIAGFTPAEQQAFRLVGEGAGSYMPYFRRAEQLGEQGLYDARTAADIASRYYQQAGREGAGAVREGADYLRQAPGIAAEYTGLGLDQLYGGLGGLRRAGRAGRGSTGMFDPTSAEAFYNPYEDAVVQQTLKDIEEGLGKQSVGERARQVSSGAFGGSRGRLSQRELARQGGRGAAEIIGQLRASGYGSAQQQAQQAFEAAKQRQAAYAGLLGNLGQAQGTMGSRIAGLGQNLAGLYGNVGGGLGSLGTSLSNIYGGVGRDIGQQGLNLGQFGYNVGQGMAGLGQGIYGLQGQDINRLLGIGGMQRGLDQSALDLAYQNFTGQYYLPMNLFGQFGSMAGAFGPTLGGSTTTQASGTTPSNSLMQGLGTFASLYGALK